MSARTVNYKKRYENSPFFHGHSGTGWMSPIYRTWQAMKRRCLRPRDDRWNDYGGRGIKICERWLTFVNFLADMGERPPGTSIDRIDNDGDYCKENCRWATPQQQQDNSRQTKLISFNGETRSVRGWARKLSIAQPSMRWRLKHWSLERALTELAAPGARGEEGKI